MTLNIIIVQQINKNINLLAKGLNESLCLGFASAAKSGRLRKGLRALTNLFLFWCKESKECIYKVLVKCHECRCNNGIDIT